MPDESEPASVYGVEKTSAMSEQPVSASIPPETARDLALIRGSHGANSPTRRKRRVARYLLLLAFLLAGMVVAGLKWQPGAFAPPEVSVVAVGQREIGMPPVKLRVTGYLAARRQIIVSSLAQGKIIEMPVAENQHVEEGALLARLANREQQANLHLAEAHLHEAQLDYERARKLFEQGSMSAAERDHAKTAYEVAEAQTELARVALAYTEIRAPMTGTVIRKIRDVGEFLTIGVTASGDPGTAVATLADLNTMFVELEINETEIHKVAIGDVALVAPEALRNRRYLADVTEVAATANRQKGMVSVKLRIRRPDPDLKPDMTAIVSFLSREPTKKIEVMLAVPASAVVERGGKQVVFVVDNDTVTAVPVQASDDGQGHAALAQGPAEGAYVVENPPATLQSGQKIRLKKS
jgi:HlyD family secretion protein